MIYFLILVFTIGGFAALCASRERHQPGLFGHKLSSLRGRVLRVTGWGSIGLSLFIATRLGWALGAITWAGALSLGALLSVLMLTRASHHRQKKNP